MSLPDLSTLTSSSQIFDTAATAAATSTSIPPYTLPQIRSIHKALQAAVDDKRNRLRVQVGSSYRELLGTADAIVAMRGDMDSVLGILGGLGSRCGRSAVGRKVGGLGRFVGEVEEEEEEDGRGGGGGREVGMGAVARARMVEGCAVVVEGLLRGRGEKEGGRGERLVTAAKVLVLSRLLGKSLVGEEGISGSSVGTAVEAAKKSLESSKRRLLRIINRVLQTVGERKTDRDDVLKALAAYSLATSSGARDVLWQFLKVRGEAMKMTFELDEDERVRSTDDVLRGVRLYTKTLLDVQALVPNRLMEALGSLKKQPLVKDAALKRIEGLRLDVYERWCGDEIEYFTPFIRHDDLDGKQAREMLSSWAKNGADVLLQGLEKTLEDMTELKAIVEMRTSVLKLWIADGGKAKGFDPSVVLDQIRDTINQHMLNVVEVKVSKLRLVGSEVSATLDSWREGVTNQRLGLWEQQSFDMDLTNGAAGFAQEVVSRLYGRSNAVSKAVSGYKSWFRVVDDVGQVVDQLRRQRWDNDDDEIEDEETIEQREQLLSKDDPQSLHDSLDKSLVSAFKALDGQLQALWDSHNGGSSRGDIAMYLLRILRDIRAKLPDLKPVKGFGLEILPKLHEVVASTAVEAPLEDLIGNVLSRKSVVGRTLWEGEPELPTSPSPGVFKFLRDLSMSMSDAGMDLWYPALLTTMKEQLGRQLYAQWLEAVESLGAEKKQKETEDEAKDETEPEDEAGPKDEDADDSRDATASPAPTDQQRKDLLVQWLFDIMYLGCFLTPSSSAGELKKLQDAVHGHTELDELAVGRMTKGTQEFWKRTSLLFGLLA